MLKLYTDDCRSFSGHGVHYWITEVTRALSKQGNNVAIYATAV